MKANHILFILMIIVPFLLNSQDELEVLLTFEVPEDSVYFDAFPGASDINDDGYSDLLFYYKNYVSGEYRLQLYLGSEPPSNEPNIEYYPANHLFWATWFGDLNNDGYSDIILNGDESDYNAGSFYVYFMNEDYFFDPDNPDIIFYGQNYIFDPVDFNFSGFNYNLNFNGDEYSDILAGGLGPSLWWNGQIDIFYGGDQLNTIPDFQITGELEDQFGLFNAAGDINGDGYDDLICSRNINFIYDEYLFEVYLGSPDMDDEMDYQLSDVYISTYNPILNGDINYDGKNDLIIVSIDNPNQVYIDIFFGNENGISTYDVRIVCEAPVGQPFYCNINNDQYSDVAVSFYTYLAIYYGGEIFDSEPDIIYVPEEPVTCLGNGYDFGDYNGDGRNDIIIRNGSPYRHTANVLTLNTNKYLAPKITISSEITSNVSPNPFNYHTSISYELTHRKNIELVIYDIKGQFVKTLINETQLTGEHSIIWNGDDQDDRPVPSGVYLYQIKAGKQAITKKILLLR